MSEYVLPQHHSPHGSSESNALGGVRAVRFSLPRSPRWYQLAADIVAFVASFVFYYYIRFASGWFESLGEFAGSGVLTERWEAMTVMVAYWGMIFWFSGLYADWYIRSPFDEVFTVIRITFIGCCIVAAVIIVDDDNLAQQNSRFIIVLYWLGVCGSVCVGRILARASQRWMRKRRIIAFPVLLVGCALKVRELYDSVLRAREFGYYPIGAVMTDTVELEHWHVLHTASSTKPERLAALPVLGTLADIPILLNVHNPVEVLVSVETPSHEEMLQLAMQCDEQGVAMKIVPDLYEIFSGQSRTTQIYGISLIEVSSQLLKPWEELLKRLMDIVLSGAILVFGAPVWILVGVIVRLETPGPALFTQKRVGKNGKVFVIYKFRSMFSDSERHGPQWTKVNDARVTTFGKFIRKTHLDEIPQMWNILKGEMSLIGPRPEQPSYVEKFTKEVPYYPRRHKVRPGLTGWWQVQYHNYEESLDEIRNRLAFDFYYIENMSFRLDLEILARTVVRVFKGHGQA